MPYLKRISYRPPLDKLSRADARFVLDAFQVAANEVVVNQQSIINWQSVTAVHVAQAARIHGPGGWLVRLFYGLQTRYHVAIYAGSDETVIKNVSLPVAEYIVKMVAYYAPHPVDYQGPESIAPLDTDVW